MIAIKVEDVHSEVYGVDTTLKYKEHDNLSFSERLSDAIRIIDEIKAIKLYPKWQQNRGIFKATMMQLEYEFKVTTGDTIILYIENKNTDEILPA
jgi:hypothetical protein